MTESFLASGLNPAPPRNVLKSRSTSPPKALKPYSNPTQGESQTPAEAICLFPSEDGLAHTSSPQLVPPLLHQDGRVGGG